ncbi:radical SAM protein [Patescibacteria group bacterium]|nr:radical SAM protein [Patescibacteria group bacterium]
MHILLVEPNFPYPTKSKNKANGVHKNFVPIGLLKLGNYHKSLGDKVKLVRGKKTKKEIDYFKPVKILITSLFTYWSKYVWDTVEYYRKLFPKAKIIIGGVYVTLHHETEEFKNLARKYKVNYEKGVNQNAENFLPDYSLIEGKIDYHVMHGMRGCIRRCKFCGTWKIEPKMTYKNADEIIKEIIKVGKNRVIFYDNNFLANPHKKEILKEIVNLRINGRPVSFESQSGFDGRLLSAEPDLAVMLKKARFYNIRIAWDNDLKDAKLIKKQLVHLLKAGYPSKDIAVFMIYNFDTPYEAMLKKLEYCKKWGVQVADCRYRPLESASDNFQPSMWRRGQTEKDYYIHTKVGWSDTKIRDFRKRARQHNIEIRYDHPYNKKMEKWSAIHNTFKFFKIGRPPQINKIENSKFLQMRVDLLNRLKNLYKKNNLEPPNLKNISIKGINEFLNNFIKRE